MRLIDADALMEECQLAQKQADRHGREYANAFYSGSMDISTEWWCVEDMIENAHTVDERKKGKWIEITDHETPIVCKCTECGWLTTHYDSFSFCPNCGADMRGES